MPPEQAITAAREACTDALCNLVDALTMDGHWPSSMRVDDRCIACNALLAADAKHEADCAAVEADAAIAQLEAAYALEDA